MSELVLSLNLGGANAYLLRGHDADLLVDTGLASQRDRLMQSLDAAGVGRDRRPLLVLLTHADADHIGNAAAIRERFPARIAMHPLEAAAIAPNAPMGKPLPNRSREPQRNRLLLRLMALLGKPDQAPRFRPDILLDGQASLETYGIEGSVVVLPGHTSGSIGVLTNEGDLFCGDLMTAILRPRLHFLLDDVDAARQSLHSMRPWGVRRVYPGHGWAFRLGQIKGWDRGI